jgi:hypothetical protein
VSDTEDCAVCPLRNFRKLRENRAHFARRAYAVAVCGDRVKNRKFCVGLDNRLFNARVVEFQRVCNAANRRSRPQP